MQVQCLFNCSPANCGSTSNVRCLFSACSTADLLIPSTELQQTSSFNPLICSIIMSTHGAATQEKPTRV
jgi:hypothetical protein